jgi:RNA polymerase sigma factor (TIGR02999 family)
VDDITLMLDEAREGTTGAADRLFAAMYPELRKLARSRLRDGGRSTCLDTTALVHESYLRWLRQGDLRLADRRSFFAYAARVMHSVIVDTVRERQAQRRGGDLLRLTLDTQLDVASDGEAEILQVHDALVKLRESEPRLASVVEMRYFGGYTESEIAGALQVTERTVRRDWEKARLLLLAVLN